MKGNDIMNLIPRDFYLDDIFDDFMPSKENNMKCDIYEKDNTYHIEVDVPGFDKEDIKVSVDNGYINISAKKESKEEDHKDKKYLRRERSYHKVSRSFYLGDIDESKIDAKFNNGTLKLSIPKKQELDKQKYIEIK